MQKRMIAIAALVLLVIPGCGEKKSTETVLAGIKGGLLDAKQISGATEIRSNILKVIKTRGGSVEELDFAGAVVEQAGTPGEKVCLCQAIGFRVAQLAAQAWDDGIFRSYEIEKIRTGWNSDGPYEMFSDREFHGEKGNLLIPGEKIQISDRNGGKPTPGKSLGVNDLWYEITFSGGLKMFFNAVDGDKAIFTPDYMELRSEYQNGNLDIAGRLKAERKVVESNVSALPFSGIAVKVK